MATNQADDATSLENTGGDQTGVSQQQTPMQVVRLDDLQATVDTLVQRALERSESGPSTSGKENRYTLRLCRS